MSVERDPQVGDLFSFHKPGAAGWRYLIARVEAVTEHNVLYEFVEGARRGGAEPIWRWRVRATLVPPRPKIRDQWGCVHGGRFYGTRSEQSARCGAPDDTSLARIVNGVVCDEHGVPLEVSA